MRDEIFHIVGAALKDLNEELDYDSLREIDGSTPIFGGVEGIDSLSLVALVASLEHQISKTFEKQVVIADEKVMSERNSPFKTVDTLVEFISAKLSNGAHA